MKKISNKKGVNIVTPQLYGTIRGVLRGGFGTVATAQRCGVSESTVKLVRRSPTYADYRLLVAQNHRNRDNKAHQTAYTTLQRRLAVALYIASIAAIVAVVTLVLTVGSR